VARSVLLRRIERLGEVNARWALDEAAALAGEVRRQMACGFHATTYLPEAWLIVGRALRCVGDVAGFGECLIEAQRWVKDIALPHVPLDRHDAFLTRNPINWALFQADRT
jgi:hypothetical protein